MNRIFPFYAILFLSLVFACPSADAQWFGRKKATPQTEPEAERSKYDSLLKDVVSDAGMFTVHRSGTDYYFEIPDSLFGRDILVINKISGVPPSWNERMINKGISYDEKTVRFRKDTLQRKVWLTVFDAGYSAPESDRIRRSVEENHRESVIEYFNIEALSNDSTAVVIKVNKIFDGSEKSVVDVFSIIASSTRKELSRIESMRSFPRNIMVKALHTSVSHGDEQEYVSVDITTNMVLLDRRPMTARFSDERIGYFTNRHIFYNDTQQRPEEREFIHRWRLEPREEDRERYLRGEKVEPAKPIEFFIDPATPPAWIPYIIQGVEDWQAAFEQAGFINAITAREVDPVLHPDFDIDDVRYSVITYAASQSSNAMGPSVIDPRSGEIIEADVIWWHNVMDLLHMWVRVQTGAVDPRARGNELPEDLMGNAIRFVSSHELGHSLGLKHNFGASYCVPVDSLRSKTYTDANGTASSIMDYARFNYVAQPGDPVTELTPRIGTYDKYAIEWGYRWYGATDPRTELPVLNAAIRLHEDDPRYWYGAQLGSLNTDPRAQSEDLGDDAVKAGTYGVNNLRYMIPYVDDWTSADGQLNIEANKFLSAIINQWQTYNRHVLANVGGIYVNNVVGGRELDRFVPVPGSYQRQCVAYLLDNVLEIPGWLFDAPVWNRARHVRRTPYGYAEDSGYAVARSMQSDIYWNLLTDDRLLRMYDSQLLADGDIYTPEQMMADITSRVFRIKAHRTLSLFERMSQKNYVDALIVGSNRTMVKTTRRWEELRIDENVCTLFSRSDCCGGHNAAGHNEAAEDDNITSYGYYTSVPRVSDTASAKRGELERILGIVSQRTGVGDTATRDHYRDLQLRLKEALQAK